MNFYNYMTRNFIDEDSPRGDLAKDMKMDKAAFPKNGVGKFDGWYKIIRDISCIKVLALSVWRLS